MQYLYKLLVHVYWTKVSDAHITNNLKWLCIVSINPRLVIFAFLHVYEKCPSFSTQTIMVTLIDGPTPSQTSHFILSTTFSAILFTDRRTNKPTNWDKLLSQLTNNQNTGILVSHFTGVMLCSVSQHHIFIVQFPSRDLKMAFILLASVDSNTTRKQLVTFNSSLRRCAF